MFNEEWVKELTDKGIFTGDFKKWTITEDNIAQVLQAISVNTAHYKSLVIREIKASGNNHISYEALCNIFQVELAKATQTEFKAFDDTDLFKTPAQKIISMLREIQNKFLAEDIDHSSQQMIERINYAIDKINDYSN